MDRNTQLMTNLYCDYEHKVTAFELSDTGEGIIATCLTEECGRVLSAGEKNEEELAVWVSRMQTPPNLAELANEE